MIRREWRAEGMSFRMKFFLVKAWKVRKHIFLPFNDFCSSLLFSYCCLLCARCKTMKSLENQFSPTIKVKNWCAITCWSSLLVLSLEENQLGSTWKCSALAIGVLLTAPIDKREITYHFDTPTNQSGIGARDGGKWWKCEGRNRSLPYLSSVRETRDTVEKARAQISRVGKKDKRLLASGEKHWWDDGKEGETQRKVWNLSISRAASLSLLVSFLCCTEIDIHDLWHLWTTLELSCQKYHTI